MLIILVFLCAPVSLIHKKEREHETKYNYKRSSEGVVSGEPECKRQKCLNDDISQLEQEIAEGIRSSVIELCSRHENYNLCKSQNENEETFLHIACRLGHLDIVKVLTENYQCVYSVYDKFGNSPCHSACANGQLKIMDYLDKLLSYNRHCRSENNNGDSLLHLACKSGYIPLIRMIIVAFLPNSSYSRENIKLSQYYDEVFSVFSPENYCTELNCMNKQGHNPLQVAYHHGHKHVLDFFCTEYAHTFRKHFSDMIPSLQTMALQEYDTDTMLKLPRQTSRQYYEGLVMPTQVGLPQGFKNERFNVSYSPATLVHAKSVYYPLQETILFSAVRKRKKEFCNYIFSIIEQSLLSFPKQNSQGDTLLHAACTTCDKEFFMEIYDKIVVKEYMTREDLKNSINELGNTCLHIACELGSLELTKHLVNCLEYSINAQNKLGLTPLHLSVLNEKQKVFEFLIQCKDIDVNVVTKSKETPLHMAACNNSCLSYATKIVSHDQFKSADYQDDRGETPLFNACRTRSMELVNVMLNEANCSIDMVNNKKETVAHIAVRSRWFELLDIILSNTAYPKNDSEVQSLLKASTISTYYETNAIDERNMITYLSENMSSHTYDVVDDVNKVDNSTKLTPLQLACHNNNVDKFKQLLSIPGCDCEVKNDDGDTVLHICCALNRKNIAELCIKQSSVTIRNHEGNTPLHVAITSKNHSLFNFLLNQTKCNRMDKYYNKKGDNILHVAARDGTVDILHAITQNCIVDFKSKNPFTGNTALHIACGHNNIENAKFLMQYKYDKDIWLNIKGESPLSMAASWTDKTLIEILFKEYQDECLHHNVLRINGIETQLNINDSVEIPFSMFLIYRYLRQNVDNDITINTFPMNALNELIDNRLGRVVDTQGSTIFHYLTICKYNFNNCFQDMVEKVFNTYPELLWKLNSRNESCLEVACKNRCDWMIWKVLNLENVNYDFINDSISDTAVIQKLLDFSHDTVYLFIAKGAKLSLSELSPSDRSDISIPSLKILVVGNSGVGKTTLINTLKYFADCKEKLNIIEPTTGIVPVEVNYNKTYYHFIDFAGQPEFEEGSAKFIAHSMSSLHQSDVNTTMFLIMVKANESIENNKKQIKNWLELIRNCMKSSDTPVHIMLVCSHADCLEEKQRHNIVFRLALFFREALSHPLTNKDIRLCMDCQIIEEKIADPDSVKKLMNSLEEECLPLPHLKISSSASELKHFINKYFDNSPFQMLCLVKKIKQCRIFCLNDSGKIVMKCTDDQLSVPEAPKLLAPLLEELQNHSFVMLLNQSKHLLHWWIITKTVQDNLFSKAASLFSPADFANRPSFPNFTYNTGVVPVTELKDTFKKMNLDFSFEVFQNYLISMNYCISVEWGILKANLNAKSSQRTTYERYKNDELFFFPSFLKNKVNYDEIYQKKEGSKFSFGWIMKSEGKLGQHFVHTVLLKLTFNHAPTKCPDNYFDRHLCLWKYGIFWCTEDLVEILVEITNDCEVLLLSRGASRCRVAKYTSQVVREIRAVKEELILKSEDIPLMDEFCLCPSPSDYKSCRDSVTISLQSLIECFKKSPDLRSCYIDSTHPQPLSDFLVIDPYVVLETEVIQSLNSDKKISEILHPFIQEFLTHCKCETKGLSYSELCSKLNEYSIFDGKELCNSISEGFRLP